MIFKLKKALFKEINDYMVHSNDDSLKIKVAKLKKGYYLYNTKGVQVGQITFYKGKAIIVAPESASLTIIRNVDNSYAVMDTETADEELKEIKNKQMRKKSFSEYMIYGNAESYNYDIYEKQKNIKTPKIVANVINDIYNSSFYKVRILGGSNLLKIIMLCLVIDKLNLDKENKY